MIIISNYTDKGGLGKTTTTVNTGAALAYQGYKTLLVDMDPRSHLSKHVGIKSAELKLSLQDVLVTKEALLSDIIFETSQENLYIAPSKLELGHLAEEVLTKRKKPETILENSLKSVQKHFDFIFIDSPPGGTLLSKMALYASDFFIIPTSTKTFDLSGIDTLFDVIEKLSEKYASWEYRILGVLLNNFDMRLRKANQKGLEILEEVFGESDFVLESRIRTDVQIDAAQDQGKTVFQYNVKGKAAEDFLELSKEIIEKLRDV